MLSNVFNFAESQKKLRLALSNYEIIICLIPFTKGQRSCMKDDAHYYILLVNL